MAPIFHWLPEPLRVSLVQRFELGHQSGANSLHEAGSKVKSVRLLDRKMYRALLSEAEIPTE